jgi:glycosyltransferase involved in cell wall biosynthesis
VRLLVVTQYFWPENFRVNDLVAELVSRGHEVTVLTGWPNYPDGKIFSDFRENPRFFDEYKGARVVRVPMLPRGQGDFQLILNYFSFALTASVLGSWRLRGHRFDSIFACQLSPVTVGIPAAVFRAIKKAPLAFWVLDLWPETLQAIGVVRSKFILKIVGKLVASIYKRCDLILAQSKSLVPAITKYTRQGARIEYFPSWAESVFNMQNVLAAPEIPLKTGCFNVLFAGNIGDAQDFPAIVAAAEILKHHQSIRWLIVGDGRMAGWVAGEIRKRGLQDSMLMLGRYPVERMPSFFKHADALLVSLKDEPIFALTIPGKLQSYLAAGIPVLAMLNGEGAVVVQNGGAGLACRAGDHKALAEAVLKLSTMSIDERKAMGLNGVVLSKEEFGREKLIGQLEAWLESLQFRGRHQPQLER